MSSNPPLKLEYSLYIAILVLALASRFFGLGATPLTEAEAQLALPAYQIAQGADAGLGSQPGYVILTSALFSLLGGTDFLARFWPALFGSALVLLPYFWRETLGRSAALLLALGLALDPGLIAFSRAANGLVIGLAAALWALTAWREGRSVWAGILAVVALYSSPHLYIGLLALGLTLLTFQRFSIPEERNALGSLAAGDNAQWQTLWVSALITVILGASLLLRLPAGLAAIVAPATGFMQQMLSGGGDGLSLILLAVLAYGLLPLVFGWMGATRTWRQGQPLGRFLSLFAITALILVVLNPGRQVVDLIWVLLPLWVLAAQQLARYLKLPDEEPLAAFGQAALALLLGAFLVLNLARLSSLPVTDPSFNSRLLVAGAVVALGVIASAMIAFGWSRQASAYGLAWSFAILLLLATLSAGWRLAQRPHNAANDLWLPGPAAGQADLLFSVVEDISEMQTGELRQLAIEPQTSLASLAWVLRSFTERDAPLQERPAVIIANGGGSQPVEAAAYRGQNFVWQVQRAWFNAWPDNIFAWWLYRDGPTQTEELLLWARADLFPGGLENLESESAVEPVSP